MTSTLTRITLLALVSIAGITGMLLVDGAWDWLFLAFAALSLLLGGTAIVVRRVKTGTDRWT